MLQSKLYSFAAPVPIRLSSHWNTAKNHFISYHSLKLDFPKCTAAEHDTWRYESLLGTGICSHQRPGCFIHCTWVHFPRRLFWEKQPAPADLERLEWGCICSPASWASPTCGRTRAGPQGRGLGETRSFSESKFLFFAIVQTASFATWIVSWVSRNYVLKNRCHEILNTWVFRYLMGDFK